jgi:hypothetical protein
MKGIDLLRPQQGITMNDTGYTTIDVAPLFTRVRTTVYYEVHQIVLHNPVCTWLIPPKTDVISLDAIL